jgi:hypothetical protein
MGILESIARLIGIPAALTVIARLFALADQSW